MARAYEQCVIDLTAAGVEQDKAKRACAAAFWAEHGMFPEEADARGLELGGGVQSYAWACAAEMSKPPGQHATGCVFAASDLAEVARLDGYAAMGEGGAVDDPEDRPDRILREVLMLRPGKLVDANGREFEFTSDDMMAYRDNFNPLDQPPILLDHEMSARATVGRLRAVRVGEDYSLMGLWEILGAENVSPVLDGRWSRTSGRFVKSEKREEQRILEGSIVVLGAFDRGFGDRAQILGRKKTKGKDTMSVQAQAAAQKPAQDKKAAEGVSAPETGTDHAALLAKLAEMEAKIAELSKPATAETKAPAKETEVDLSGIQDAATLAAVQQLMATWQAKFDAQQTEMRQQAELAAQERRAQSDAAMVNQLVELGKAEPADIAAEMAIMSALPEDKRAAYLDLRKKLPNKWHPGPRQSAVLAKGPAVSNATDPEAELNAFAELGADLGFGLPATAKTAQAK